MNDIVKRIRQQSYFGLEPYEAANEIEQLRQRVQELEKQRDDFRRDAAEFSSQVSRLVDHNNNLVNHREELILEITRIKRGDFSNERIENDSLKLCINVQNEQIEKLTAERDALKQQRDDLLVAQQWQPINTAPKEGLFLVHRKHTAYPIVAHVYKPYGSICDYVFGELLHNVTHWMPLPPAPAIASVKEKQNAAE